MNLFDDSRWEGGIANEFDFAGQQTDPTGLQYLRARYYDPATGTFLSRDPLNSRIGWTGNETAYANGSPARFVDPAGLEGGETSVAGGSQQKASDEEFYGGRWWEWELVKESTVRTHEYKLNDFGTSAGLRLPLPVIKKLNKIAAFGACVEILGCEYKVKTQMFRNRDSGKWFIRTVKEWYVHYAVGVGIGVGPFASCQGIFEVKTKVHTETLY